MRRRTLAVRARAAAALAVLAWCSAARPDAPEGLNVSWPVDGAVTGAAAAVAFGSELASGALAPLRCRWCGSNGLDDKVRDAVVWTDRQAASTLSDLLAVGVPLGVAAYDVLAARARGDGLDAAKDVLVIAEAIAITGVLTQASKYSFARIRPYAYHSGVDAHRADHLSFWSGHTAVAFTAAAAGGTVARLRGYEGWPWVYALGMTGAALTGYLRMASDNHWFTDVLVSAAVGTGVGILVPTLHRGDPSRASYRIAPTPGGIAVVGTF